MFDVAAHLLGGELGAKLLVKHNERAPVRVEVPAQDIMAAPMHSAVGVEWVMHDVVDGVEWERRAREHVMELPLEECAKDGRHRSVSGKNDELASHPSTPAAKS